MEQIIYLEVDDNILVVRDRLRRAQSKHVLLVVPPGCKALTRSLDLRLLRRQAAALQMNVALVSDSASLRDMAQEEGLTVLARLSVGQRIARRDKPWRSQDRPGLDGLVERLKRERPRWWHWVLGPIVVALVLGVLAWSVIMVWPSATVGLVRAREPVGVSIWVEAGVGTRAVDWDRQIMPARVVQVEIVDRGEVETTGITNVAAAKAQGTVLFVNSLRRDISIPMDTIVSTSAGTPVRFRTMTSVTIGSRGRVRVPIEALEGGPGGNVGANLINRIEGPLSIGLKVTNTSATSGGSNDQVRRVTHGDKQHVSDLMIEKLIQKGHAELSALLEDEFLPIESMQINQYSIRTNYDHHVDDVSDTLALEMRAVVWGLAISEEAAEEMTKQALLRQVRGGFYLLPETIHVTRGNSIQIGDEYLSAQFLMEGVALMEAEIDVRLLQQAIRGRPLDEAQAYMRETLPLERDPTLIVHPDWMKRVPFMPFRILVIEEERFPEEEVARALPGP